LAIAPEGVPPVTDTPALPQAVTATVAIKAAAAIAAHLVRTILT
jgi:hypothetical protein